MTKKTCFGRWYHKCIGQLIPDYALVPLVLCWMFNSLVYTGTQILCAGAKHYDFTSKFDRQVPFVKEWIWIYVICFGFWGINYILISREGKEHFYRFVSADMLSRFICGIFFVLVPTTNERPEVLGTDISSHLVRFIYSMDRPTNLFPSIHCLVSWFCFIGLARSQKIPKWYKAFSFVFAILVCCSTQFTKQHYMIDVFAGIAIAQMCYMFSKKTDFYKKLLEAFEKISSIVLGEV